ncbi:MAG: hypothetical protein ABIH41_06565 [Nanoarchaeota archaeon]
MTYTLDRMLGMGYHSAVFALHGHPRLCAKIRYTGSIAQQQEEAATEWKKAEKLRALQIPIAKHAGIIEVLIPENIKQIIAAAHPKHEQRAMMEDELKPGLIVPGLVIQLIENDDTIIPLDGTLPHDVEQQVRDTLRRLFEMGIKGQDAYQNVLWCKRRKKLYFIDVEHWIGL